LANAVHLAVWPYVAPEIKQTVANAVVQMAGDRSVEQLADEENAAMKCLFSDRARRLEFNAFQSKSH